MDANSPTGGDLVAAIAHELPVGIWVARAPDGAFLYANRAFAEIVGMEALSDVAMGGIAVPYGIHTRSGEPYPEERLAFARALRERTLVHVDDLVVHRRDGTRVNVRAQARPIFDERGEPEYVVIAFIDITREVAAEQARAESEARLSRAQRMESIGNLAGGIAHDFNNLLATVQLIASRLRRGETDSSRLEDLRIIGDVVDSAAHLTRSLLGFAGRGKDLAERVSLHDVVRSVAELAQRTFDRRVEIVVQLDAEATDTLGDFSQLEQVVMNLIVNARDAMPQGGRLSLLTYDTVTDEKLAARVPGLRVGRYVVLAISDTGTGIPPELRDKIFEPYFTTKTTGPLRGSGLGLATVHGIVETHGGAIEVESVSPHGTTMRVYFPNASRHADAPRHVMREASGPARPGNGTVLVIDDEPLVRIATARALHSLGYEVLASADGDEAIRTFGDHAHRIGVVIIDMVMPRLDGRATYLALRAIKPDVSAVLTTGHALNEEAQSILALGVKEFLRKPAGLDVLAETVARAMQASRK